ncbi:MAG: hypothetical protein AABZ39_08910 [Spirochaetota bacterium]
MRKFSKFVMATVIAAMTATSVFASSGFSLAAQYDSYLFLSPASTYYPAFGLGLESKLGDTAGFRLNVSYMVVPSMFGLAADIGANLYFGIGGTKLSGLYLGLAIPVTFLSGGVAGVATMFGVGIGLRADIGYKLMFGSDGGLFIRPFVGAEASLVDFGAVTVLTFTLPYFTVGFNSFALKLGASVGYEF